MQFSSCQDAHLSGGFLVEGGTVEMVSFASRARVYLILRLGYILVLVTMSNVDHQMEIM
jgi:hypothetical protein